MPKALEGENYCAAHQGNHSHYAPHNCALCTARAAIKPREEVARFIESQFYGLGIEHVLMTQKRAWHYGRQDVRVLMDFIYGREPQTEEEKIRNTA